MMQKILNVKDSDATHYVFPVINETCITVT